MFPVRCAVSHLCVVCFLQQTEEKCRALYSAGMQLAASTRPQDCGTAAYIFRLLLQQPCAEGIVQSHGPVPQLDLRCSSEEGGAAGGREMLADIDSSMLSGVVGCVRSSIAVC